MKNLKSHSKLAAAITLALAALAATNAGAQETRPADEVTFNAALSSDYRYRGLSQSRLKPALSGGADYVN
ncbi:MAG TPA: TorF family putative porin, partial [Telluria sp.]